MTAIVATKERNSSAGRKYAKLYAKLAALDANGWASTIV
jgi:hypothetical protein